MEVDYTYDSLGNFVGKGSVVIQFESNSAFEPDLTTNAYAAKYMPVSSYFRGPVEARNAIIVRIN